jgi:hypothetical protein
MKIFKNRFTEKEAAKVIGYFEAKAEEKISQKKVFFMTKDDKVELISRNESSKTDIIKWVFIFLICQLAVKAILFA